MKLLRFKEVQDLVGLSRTTIWRFERDGVFPRRRRLGQNAVGWIEKEVHDWIKGREDAEARRQTMRSPRSTSAACGRQPGRGSHTPGKWERKDDHEDNLKFGLA